MAPYPRERIQRLFRFIDWLLILPASLRVRSTDDVRRILEEKRIPYISTVERDNIAAATAAATAVATQQGLQQGQASLLLRQLERRFGGLDDDARAAIAALPVPRLEALADALCDFASVDDVRRWLTAT